MGKFKRKKAKLAAGKEKEKEGIQNHNTFKDKLELLEVFKNVLGKLILNGIIKRHSEIVVQKNTNVLVCKIVFTKTEMEKGDILIFFSKKFKEPCLSLVSKGVGRFGLFLTDETNEDNLYKTCSSLFESLVGGFVFETKIINALNLFFQQNNHPRKRVEHSRTEEDRYQKIDMIIHGFKEPFGVQIKKSFEDWSKHRKNHRGVPSILIPENFDIQKLFDVISKIAKDLEKGFAGHSNMIDQTYFTDQIGQKPRAQ